jgi:hypothetical protein
MALKSNLKPYLNAEIFRDYIRTVFLPNFAELRVLDEVAEEMALLLMDNWSSNITTFVNDRDSHRGTSPHHNFRTIQLRSFKSLM